MPSARARVSWLNPMDRRRRRRRAPMETSMGSGRAAERGWLSVKGWTSCLLLFDQAAMGSKSKYRKSGVGKTGSAACRERVWKNVNNSRVAESVKQQNKITDT